MRSAIVVVLALAAACHDDAPVSDAGVRDAGVIDAGVKAADLDVRIAAVTGTVEVKRQGAKDWVPVEAGAVLKKDDEVRTGPGATVELDAAGNVVELQSGTDVKVDELTEGLTRYLLGTGLVAADAHDEKNKLQIGVAGTDVNVSATAGRFRMSSNGQGTVAVGAQEGNVAVSAAGKEVVLKKGERTLVEPGKQPRDPSPLAQSLLLKVSWPSERETNKKRITVSGRTESGALVFVAGRPATVRSDGTFSVVAPLGEGVNTLEAHALDVSGNVQKAAGPRLLVDTHGASSRFQTDDLWKKPGQK